MKPKFEPTEDGLEIIDPIERHRYQLTTHEAVDPVPIDPDQMQFPVSTAVEITTEMITLPTNETVYVRNDGGKMIAEVRPSKQSTLPHGEYILDISGPLKVYARVKSSVSIYSDREHTYITFGGATRTLIGARSYHRRPAETITTTSDPEDVMKAVSMFGSTLKSITPERSYPTHRGHPPAIKRGEELNIPDKIERPNTGIQIEIPPSLEHIFVVTPLAYYLGAKVVPGSTPQIVSKNDFITSLNEDHGFETSVERILKQIFFFDCIVRTEGSTPLPLHERQEVESKLDFDFSHIYNQTISEQIREYLSISFDTVEPYFPKWRLETVVNPTIKMVDFLPFLTDNLAIINIQKNRKEPTITAQSQAIDEFTRNTLVRSTNSIRGETQESTLNDEIDKPIVKQTWDSSTASKITCRTPLSAFQHSVGRVPREDPIEIEVVCNDSEMREELNAVNGVYGVREEISFNVNTHHNVKVDRLKEILSNDIDFFHFIGHIDEDGFQCTDGKLDVKSMDSVGAKAFFLNACRSHDQGLQLVETGSIGGIVTIDDVINSGAVKIGGTIARLLNQGFPLYASLDIARKEHMMGQQYFIVGDGLTTIAQSETGPPFICSIKNENDQYNVGMETYTTKIGFQKGSLCVPYLEENNVYFLTSGYIGEFPSSKPQVEEFFQMGEFPILLKDSLDWSSDISSSEV